MKCFFRPYTVVLALLLGACSGDDKKASSGQPVTDRYCDFKVTAEEGMENAVILLQFRKGNEAGEAQLLEEGSQVVVDGETVLPDSARLAGVFYELQRPLATFTGSHTIVIRNAGGESEEVQFAFAPLDLPKLPAALSRSDLLLPVTGTKEGEKLQVLLTDTSFTTPDINENVEVNDGQLHLSAEALRKVTNGPLTLDIYQEKQVPLRKGRLVMHYTLHRELELR